MPTILPLILPCDIINVSVNDYSYENIDEELSVVSSAEGTEAAPVAGEPPPPLRRNRRFQLLWIGSTVGFLGSEAAEVTYPLVILAVTGSPAQAGLFAFVQLLAGVVLALPAGEVVDRWDCRRVLLLAEGGRALVAGSVAVALMAGHLTMVHLLVAAAVLGAGSAFGGPARMLVVRAVVPSSQLTAALTQEEVRNSAASLAGPPLGGLLYGLKQILPFLFCSVSFAVSWFCILIVRTPARITSSTADPAPENEAGGMLMGVKALWDDPVLRAATLAVTALNTAGAPLVLIATIILQRQHTPSWIIGTVMAGLALGGLAGAALVGPLHRRLRPGVLLVGVVVMQVPVFAALVLPFGPWWVMAVLGFAMLGVPALSVLIDVLVFRGVPDDRQGRVIAAASMLFGLGGPLGAVGAGLMLQYLSVSTTMLVFAAMLAITGGYAASRKHLREAPWPITTDQSHR
jgi:MFS family permease